MRLFLLLVASLTAGCAPVPVVPFESYDYSTRQVALGLSFPPANGADQYRFTLERMTELSMRRLRLDLHWDYVEPQQGPRDWSSLETRLNTLAGQLVFLTIDLKSLPGWFAGLDHAAQQAAVRAFVSELLERFGDKIHALQFGNEWNWEVDKHFGGALDQFIALADLVGEEVMRRPAPRPEVVLASFSTSGLSALALAQGRLENVTFDGKPLYTQAEVDALDRAAYLDQVNRLVRGIRFEALDLHFYADHWNWRVYLDAVNQALADAGRAGSFPVIASEFGGPHPVMEPRDQLTQAERIVSYVHVLDDLGVRDAYFFKLVENPAHNTEFWNSFLYDSALKPTAGFEVLRRFGVNAAER